MGAAAARNGFRIVENVEAIVGIELLCAAQALDLRLMQKKLRLGDGAAVAHRAIREKIPILREDRALYRDIRAATDLVREGVVLKAAEDTVGPLA
ncbi:MAG: aromatic amino acid lyase, partial [Aigarchaeota archaeon]|nr:aromatic amino acid lyase [Aigarchaeota archaeon]